jgi:hypothetical protein
VTSLAPKHHEVRGPKKKIEEQPLRPAQDTAGIGKKEQYIYQLHPPGVEPEPIAWKAIILPLDQECFDEVSIELVNLFIYQNASHSWKRQFPASRGAW